MFIWSHNIFLTQVKIYVVQWKTYVVMSLQGYRSIKLTDCSVFDVIKQLAYLNAFAEKLGVF